ncbi:MAG: baseplate hub protein [Pyrinomonadaceae bacterium]
MSSRIWGLDVNGVPFIADQSGLRMLRVAFSIDVNPGDTTAYADIRLYNLSKQTTINQGDSISFRAGFTDNVNVIFTGIVTNSLRERNPGEPEIVTRLLCRASNAKTARGSACTAFGPNTRITEVLRALAAAWPIPIDIVNSHFEGDPVFTSGYVVDGDIPSALEALAYAYKFTWVEENGRLVITKAEKDRTSNMQIINQFSGMIGIPEVSKGPNGLGVFVMTRLDPFLRVTDRVFIQSEFQTFNTGNLFMSELSGDARANGEYNVQSLKHVGDSHGDAWRTEIEGIKPGTEPAIVLPSPDNGKLIWGQRVTQEFRVKVRSIAKNLNLDPNWLMAVMNFETGGTFSPSVRNPGSTATGLIQFVEATARGLGTSTTALARMTAVEQLDFVEAYYSDKARRINNLDDAYLAVLWPIAVGRADNYIMWQQSTGPYQAQYAANSGLDVNRDGTITKGEAASSARTSYKNGIPFSA